MASKRRSVQVDSYSGFLRETACAQRQADIPGGDVAKRQLEITKRKLAQVGLSINHPSYLAAYEEAKKV